MAQPRQRSQLHLGVYSQLKMPLRHHQSVALSLMHKSTFWMSTCARFPLACRVNCILVGLDWPRVTTIVPNLPQKSSSRTLSATNLGHACTRQVTWGAIYPTVRSPLWDVLTFRSKSAVIVLNQMKLCMHSTDIRLLRRAWWWQGKILRATSDWWPILAWFPVNVSR